MIPEDLRYTAEHEWVGAVGGADALRVGITDFAQDSLGDIVFVDLPEVGTSVEAGQPFGEVESTKSVSELYAPVTGTVVARNDQLNEEPELVNTDPYGAGWLIELAPAAADDIDELLDAVAYAALTEQS
ncbi:glycine cleavage system protein GcvH [Luedemannella helvata]|uniref:Glycine cleavage system H protein n=1 Tax=Luedemannella helvata TaxID=349315 RepID=A0ABP4WEI4_9ACTN